MATKHISNSFAVFLRLVDALFLMLFFCCCSLSLLFTTVRWVVKKKAKECFAQDFFCCRCQYALAQCVISFVRIISIAIFYSFARHKISQRYFMESLSSTSYHLMIIVIGSRLRTLSSSGSFSIDQLRSCCCWWLFSLQQWTIYIFIDILWSRCMCLCHGFFISFRCLGHWHVVDLAVNKYCCRFWYPT